jgi:hypothetical protein
MTCELMIYERTKCWTFFFLSFFFFLFFYFFINIRTDFIHKTGKQQEHKTLKDPE